MLALTQLVGFAAGGVASIAVTLDGTHQDSASSANETYTVVGTIPVGSLVVVVAGIGNNPRTLNGITDSRGNTYTREVTSIDAGGSESMGIGSSSITTQLNPGDTITIAWNSSATGHASIVAWASNCTTSSPHDKHASKNNGSSGTYDSNSTTSTTQANEVAFGCVLLDTSNAVTEDTSYTNLAAVLIGASKRLNAGYKLVNAIGTYNYAPTGSPQSYGSIVSTYKGLLS